MEEESREGQSVLIVCCNGPVRYKLSMRASSRTNLVVRSGPIERPCFMRQDIVRSILATVMSVTLNKPSERSLTSMSCKLRIWLIGRFLARAFSTRISSCVLRLASCSFSNSLAPALSSGPRCFSGGKCLSRASRG